VAGRDAYFPEKWGLQKLILRSALCIQRNLLKRNIIGIAKWVFAFPVIADRKYYSKYLRLRSGGTDRFQRKVNPVSVPTVPVIRIDFFSDDLFESPQIPAFLLPEFVTAHAVWVQAAGSHAAYPELFPARTVGDHLTVTRAVSRCFCAL
jgi:hypothetical protein